MKRDAGCRVGIRVGKISRLLPPPWLVQPDWQLFGASACFNLRPKRLTLVLLFYFGDIVSHGFKSLDRLLLVRRQVRSIGQVS